MHSLFSPHFFSDHPDVQQWAELGQRYSQSWHGPNAELQNVLTRVHELGNCKVQVVRSVSNWSHGVLTEHISRNACEWVHNIPADASWVNHLFQISG